MPEKSLAKRANAKRKTLQAIENNQLTESSEFIRASGGYSCIGGYRAFLVAIEYPIFQLVDRLFGVFK